MEECDLLIALLRISHDLATRHGQVVRLRAELDRLSRPEAISRCPRADERDLATATDFLATFRPSVDTALKRRIK
ncbi:hypothetical protein CWO90_21315 [Bradyrhizobium sp. Leo121]|nr:hypothetical protein CWO90_21315 [Bradyrhizobium sp. Leo121]